MPPNLISFLIFPLFAYLLGAIPFSLLLGKTQGIDIRKVGSGNIGATNLTRALGRKWGIMGFILDVTKGLIPVLLARPFLPVDSEGTLTLLGQSAWLLTGAAAILGHTLPIYLRTWGGKGVATSLGVLLGIWPYLTFSSLIAFSIWIIVWACWRYVSLASIVAAAAFPLAFLGLIQQLDQWRFAALWPLFIFSSLIAILVIVRHRSNIVRLLAGTENR